MERERERERELEQEQEQEQELEQELELEREQELELGQEQELEQELELELGQEQELEQMIPLLVLLLAGVAWGGDTSTLELRDYGLVQPVRPVYETLEMKNFRWEDKPTYVVEVTTKTLPEGFYRDGSNKYTQYKITGINMVCNIYDDSKDKTVCNVMYDLAESLNEAHRRRMK